LFVAGTARSRQASCASPVVRRGIEEQLQTGSDRHLPAAQLARVNRSSRPALSIEFPPPLRRFIGNLSNLTGLLVERT